MAMKRMLGRVVVVALEMQEAAIALMKVRKALMIGKVALLIREFIALLPRNPAWVFIQRLMLGWVRRSS